MSPEQIGSGTVDRRADLYALGVIWWEILVGQRLFEDKTQVKLLMRHLHEPPRAPSVARSHLAIPRSGEDLVLRFLEKDPDRRPKDGEAALPLLLALDDNEAQALKLLGNILGLLVFPAP
jgi:serine/threonine-protein kinase